jgi:hypothetical protein
MHLVLPLENTLLKVSNSGLLNINLKNLLVSLKNLKGSIILRLSRKKDLSSLLNGQMAGYLINRLTSVIVVGTRQDPRMIDLDL